MLREIVGGSLNIRHYAESIDNVAFIESGQLVLVCYLFFDVTHEGVRHQRSKRRTNGNSIHVLVENPLKLIFGRNA